MFDSESDLYTSQQNLQVSHPQSAGLPHLTRMYIEKVKTKSYVSGVDNLEWHQKTK
jgi:hypothetical protein